MSTVNQALIFLLAEKARSAVHPSTAEQAAQFVVQLQSESLSTNPIRQIQGLLLDAGHTIDEESFNAAAQFCDAQEPVSVNPDPGVPPQCVDGVAPSDGVHVR